MKTAIAFLVFFFSAISVNAQKLDVKARSFAEPFSVMYKSAGNFFSEIKGSPIISNMFGSPDTIGFRLKLLPEGVTDWKHISGSNSEEQTIFFKLGEYSTDSAEVAKRFTDMIELVKQIDKTAVLEYDDSYSDTKIKEVRICTGNAASCGEDDPWRISLYFHRFSGNEFNVSVNIQAYPPGK
jgi:hypothetical protein